MAHAAFKNGPAYLTVEKPRVIIQKPELKTYSAATQEASSDSVGVFYKVLLILSAGFSFVSLWLAFKA